MSQRKFSFVPEEYYHVYNRGNSKQLIYRDDADYRRFLNLLFIANGHSTIDFKEVKKNNVYEFERGEQLVYIGAYCLMPNHFHILLTPAKEYGVQKFMQKLSTSYSLYFNNKYERTGSLFEGKFKAKFVDSDEYLKYLFSYIHLNPVKLIQNDWKERGILNMDASMYFLEQYRYSSFIDYDNVNKEESSEGKTFGTGGSVGRSEEVILNRKVFPEYFKNNEDFRKEIFEWITLTQE